MHNFRHQTQISVLPCFEKYYMFITLPFINTQIHLLGLVRLEYSAIFLLSISLVILQPPALIRPNLAQGFKGKRVKHLQFILAFRASWNKWNISPFFFLLAAQLHFEFYLHRPSSMFGNLLICELAHSLNLYFAGQNNAHQLQYLMVQTMFFQFTCLSFKHGKIFFFNLFFYLCRLGHPYLIVWRTTFWGQMLQIGRRK